jgi:hypothetical protein
MVGGLGTARRGFQVNWPGMQYIFLIAKVFPKLKRFASLLLEVFCINLCFGEVGYVWAYNMKTFSHVCVNDV